MLQATQMTQEVTIRDLESEKSRLKEKLSQLEEERNLLQSKTQSLDERQRQQILALEKVNADGVYAHAQVSQFWMFEIKETLHWTELIKEKNIFRNF